MTIYPTVVGHNILSQRVLKAVRVHPLETRNICTKLQGDPFNRHGGIESLKSNRSSGDIECLYKISWQYIPQVLRFFSLDQIGGLTNNATQEPRPRVNQKICCIKLNQFNRIQKPVVQPERNPPIFTVRQMEIC